MSVRDQVTRGFSTSNGNFTINATAVATGPLVIPVGRVLAFQRQWQHGALACALGWHEGIHGGERCNARGFADLLHTPEDEWM